MSTIYGIDLGTTNSCVATLDQNGNPIVIKNQDENSSTLASAIFFESENSTIIGEAAKDYVETDGDRVLQFFKRELGKPDQYPPHMVFDQEYTPVILQSLLLKRMKQYTDDQGEEMKDVVITVPAYFGFVERDLTQKAGEAIGLNVLSVINEPTAAALNYCHKLHPQNSTYLVYDLGGGTFDVSIIKMSVEQDENREEKSIIQTIATGGNDQLGGKDWDDRLFEHMLNIAAEQVGMDPNDLDQDARQAVRSKVEKLKKKLTNNDSAREKVLIDGQRVEIVVSKDEFEDITKDLVDQTMGYLDVVIGNAEKKEGHPITIDLVLLVGGSSLMPMIRNTVEARFPGIVKIEDPHEAVAKGAAIYASLKVDEIIHASTDEENIIPEDPQPNPNPGPGPDKEVKDVSPRSFGPAVYFRDSFAPLGVVYLIDQIVKVGDTLGETNTRTYETSVDHQQQIVFKVFETMNVEDTCIPCITPDLDNPGEYVPQSTAEVDQVKELGELALPLSGNDPKGTPVNVDFKAEQTGIYIKATLANDLSVTNEAKITFKGGLTEEELKKQKELLERFAISAE